MRPISTALALGLAVIVTSMAALAPVRAQSPAEFTPVPRPPDPDRGGDGRIGALIAEQAPLFKPLEPSDDEPDILLLTEAELDDLVAPIALYPDALLAQVLVAATYPLQIVKADRLLEASVEMSDDELGASLAAQDWDPSVLVLMSGFPTVVGRMADDIDWTERLGAAALDQDRELLDAVQRMRARAQAAGTLTSNEAQRVEEEEDRITIRPADPGVVYLPEYDPVTAYSVTPSSRSAPATGSGLGMLSDPLVAGALAFGGALLVDQVFGGDGDDGGDDGDGWRDYWRRSQPIDWHDREFSPRPRGPVWSAERDRHWDRAERRWRRDLARDRARVEDHRDALRWLGRDAERRAERLDALRARELDARAAARRHEDAVERQRREVREAERREEAARAARQDEQAREAERRQQDARGNGAERQAHEAAERRQEQALETRAGKEGRAAREPARAKAAGGAETAERQGGEARNGDQARSEQAEATADDRPAKQAARRAARDCDEARKACRQRK